MSVLFCHTVTVDAVMANSGHLSAITSVEVVPSAAGGDELESPLLASEEGAEWKGERRICAEIGDHRVSFYRCARPFFLTRSHFVSRFIVVVSLNPESSGLSFQLASLDETGVLNFWVSWATGCGFSAFFLSLYTYMCKGNKYYLQNDD